MSSRKAQKERARQERLAKQEERRREERRRRLRIVAAALVVTVAVSGLIVLLRPWDDPRADPFSYSSDGAAERVARAGLSPGDGPHVHPKLNVVVRDARIKVPADMGVGAQHVPMHTHEPDGTIHVEGAQEGTIRQFMALWGVAFGPDPG